MNYYNFIEMKKSGKFPSVQMHTREMMKIILLILQRFYQNDTVSDNSHLPYENNKKVGLTMISHAYNLSTFTDMLIN